jgi:hypothetical protein
MNQNLVQADAFLNPVKFHENTAKYQHITTADLQPALADLGYELFQLTQARVRKAANHGFQRHVARFRSKKTSFNGELLPEIVTVNAHLGTSSMRILLGAYRTFCANGIVVGNTFSDYRIRHVGEVQEQINTILPLVASRAPVMIEAVSSMKAKEMSRPQALEFAEKVAVERLADKESILSVDFAALLQPRRSEDLGNDLFSIYNRVQENMFRAGLTYTKVDEQGKQKTTRTRKVRENSMAYVEVNQLIWNAAMEQV